MVELTQVRLNAQRSIGEMFRLGFVLDLSRKFMKSNERNAIGYPQFPRIFGDATDVTMRQLIAMEERKHFICPVPFKWQELLGFKLFLDRIIVSQVHNMMQKCQLANVDNVFYRQNTEFKEDKCVRSGEGGSHNPFEVPQLCNFQFLNIIIGQIYPYPTVVQ